MKIPGVLVEFKGDFNQLSRDYRKVRVMSREAAGDISNAMKNAVMPSAVSRSMNKLYQDLTKVTRVAASAGTDFKKLGITLDKGLVKNIGLTEREFQKLQQRVLRTKATAQAERAFKSLARSADLSSMAMVRLRLKMGDTTGAARLMRSSVMGAAGTLKNAAGTATMVAASLAAIGVSMGYVSKSIWDTGRETMVAENAFKLIMGSVQGANAQFEFLHKTADELGQNFYTLRESYVGYLAAVKDSKLSMEEAQRAFKALTNAGAVLGLSNERMKYTFVAVEQMITKGKVSMEELRRQMGDSLYGAFQKAAKAMGITTSEMDKLVSSGKLMTEDFLPRFTRVLEKDFVGGIAEAVKAENKFAEAWTALKNEMADSGFMESTTTALHDLTDTLKDPGVKEGMAAMATGLGNILKIMAKLSKYAGLKSVMGTVNEAARLSKQGTLGVPLDEFMQKGFMERQKIVEQAKSAPEPGMLSFPIPKNPYATTSPNIDLAPYKGGVKKIKDSTINKAISKELSWLDELADDEQKAQAQKKKIQKQLDNSRANSRKYVDMWALAYRDKYAVQSRAVDAAIELEKAAQTSFSDGVKRGLADVSTEFETWADAGEAVTKSAFSGMENAITHFVTTGKTSFKDFSRSIVADMAKIASQQIAIGITGMISSGVGALFHSGGVVGHAAPSRAVPAGTFSGAPKFHNGLMPDEFPAILQKGEGVFTHEQMKALGSGGTPNIQINIENNTGTEATASTTQKWDGENYVIGVVLDAINRNGNFQRNFKGALGKVR